MSVYARQTPDRHRTLGSPTLDAQAYEAASAWAQSSPDRPIGKRLIRADAPNSHHPLTYAAVASAKNIVKNIVLHGYRYGYASGTATM
jgi:hypothetical protein